MDSFDELASEAPDWYAGIVTVLGRGKNDEALRQARDQLTLSKENVDKVAEIFAMRMIIKAQLGKGDSWSAKKSAEEALALARTSGDKKAVAGALHMLAKAELASKNLSEAMTAAKEAEAGYSGFQAGLAAVKCTIAYVLIAQKDGEKALELSNEAKQIFKGLGDYSGQASAIKVAVNFKMGEGKIYHSLILVEEMAKLFSQGANLEGESEAQLLAAEMQIQQGDLQNAMDRASAAAELFDQVGNTKKKAAAVVVMAMAFEGAGQMQDAVQAGEAAVGLYQAGRDKKGQATALLQLASTLNACNRFGAAATRLEEAAFVYRQLKDKTEEAKVMARWAKETLLMFNNKDERPQHGWGSKEKELVVKNAKKAEDLFVETGAPRGKDVAEAMLDQAKGHLMLERNEEAMTKAQESVSIFEELGDWAGQAAGYLIMGNAAFAKKDHDGSLGYLEKARECAEEAGEGRSIKDASEKIKEIGKYVGAKKIKGTRPEQNYMDIDIQRGDQAIIAYLNFEGRAMRTGKVAGSSSRVLQPGEDGYEAPAKQRVMYNLRMQRKPNVLENYLSGGG